MRPVDEAASGVPLIAAEAADEAVFLNWDPGRQIDVVRDEKRQSVRKANDEPLVPRALQVVF